MAYGLDMRKRAISLVSEGKSFREAGEMLGVSWWSISNWHKRDKECRLAASYPSSRGSYRINDDALISHLETNPGICQGTCKLRVAMAQGIRDGP